MSRKYLKLIMIALLALASLSPGLPASAAGEINVNSFAQSPGGSGDCTLGEAIQAANTDAAVDGCPAGSGADTINLPAGEYVLTAPGEWPDPYSGDIEGPAGLPFITSDITIIGALADGQPASTISRASTAPDFRHLRVNSGSLTLQNLTLTGGKGGIYSSYVIDGGAIFSRAGTTLTVSKVTFSGNQAYGGGAIYTDYDAGALTVTDSTFTGNSTSVAHGGAIHSNGSLSVERSLFENNVTAASGAGGAIWGGGTSLSITDSSFRNNHSDVAGAVYVYSTSPSTISGSLFVNNQATTRGGAVFSYSSLAITNSTFTGNTAAQKGGGIAADSSPLTLTNVTLSGNGAPIGGNLEYYALGYTARLYNTIVASPTSGANCACNSGSIVDGGGNLRTSDLPCGTANTIPVGDPRLQALADNGGQTQTMALGEGSAALEVGVAAQCPATDQRGVARPQPSGTNCDAGAFESELRLPVVSLTVGPETIPGGMYGAPYSQQFAASGGAEPYSFSQTGDLPAGLTFSSSGLLSGTATQPGSFAFTVQATDAHGVTGSREYTLVIAPVVLTVGPETIPGGMYGAPYNEQFSASGGISPYSFSQTGDLPAGLTFSSDGWLNGTPTQSGSFTFAVQATDAHGVTGSREYTLVIAPLVLTVGPETIPDATYGVPYDVTFIANGTPPYQFGISPDDMLPTGMWMDLNTGEFMGTPDVTGQFGFTVQVADAFGNTGSKHYDWTVQKATPTINISEEYVLTGETYSLFAEALGPAPGSSDPVGVQGTIAFWVNGAPIAGCENLQAPASCTNGPIDLAPGDHTIQADFTPTNSANYNTASGVDTLHVTQGYHVSGTAFTDANYNRVKDADEPGLSTADVYLGNCGDQGIVFWAQTDGDGNYSFLVPSPEVMGFSYCFAFYVEYPNAFTVYPPQITSLTADVTGMNIGIAPYYYDPQSLPNGSVGTAYNQVVTLKGGIGPFTLDYGEGATPPPGMAYEFDTATGAITISGTPTTLGEYFFDGTAVDSLGYATEFHSPFIIAADPDLTFSSSPNPSNPGDSVTFTVSGASIGNYLPVGLVTFSDGATVLCSSVPLNGLDPNTGDPLAIPAICTTSALAAGPHTITAAFTSSIEFFHNASKTLTQTVNAPATSTDLKITQTDSKDPIKQGANLVYTLVVSNLGPNPAQNVSVVDTLDPSTTYVSTSAPRGWTCTRSAGVVTCSSSSLASGSSATIKITVTVNRTAKVGKNLVNTAQVSSMTPDPVATNNSAMEKTMVVAK